MMVQESGVAVGWPLNLGHSTTGWPLGLRLRLMQEDLQWPKRPDLARSSSHISTDSSSLDTLSTISFFQDKSISLGTLIGLPMLENVGNRPHPYQQQQDRRPLLNAFPALPSTRTGSPAQRANNALRIRQVKSRLRHHGGHNSAKVHQQHFASSPPKAHSSQSVAALAGWSLLSALSCASVPAELGSVTEESAETSVAHAPLVATKGHSRTLIEILQDSDPEEHESTVAPTTPLPRTPSQQQCLNSLAKKLYDNITYEDEELELSTKNGQNCSATRLSSSDGSSSELNPLFSSSSHQAREDIEENEENDDEKHSQSSRAMATFCTRSLQEQRAPCTAIPLVALTRSSSIDSDAVLYYSKGSGVRIGCPASTSFFIDVGKWQQKQQQQGHENSQQFVDALHSNEYISRPAHDSYRNKAISAFVSRVVCCLSTPTVGSSFY